MICQIKHCSEPIHARGVCLKHFREISGPPAPDCIIPGCGRPMRARGLCQTHYKHMLLRGEPGEIRVHAPGRPGATRYGPITLTPQAQEAVERMRKQVNLSHSGAVTRAVEEWAKAQKVEGVNRRKEVKG